MNKYRIASTGSFYPVWESARIEYANGMKDVRRIVGHGLSRSMRGKCWFAFCADCGREWIIEKI